MTMCRSKVLLLLFRGAAPTTKAAVLIRSVDGGLSADDSSGSILFLSLKSKPPPRHPRLVNKPPSYNATLLVRFRWEIELLILLHLRPSPTSPDRVSAFLP